MLYQFKLNIDYIENITFVDAYIMLSRSVIYFQYEIDGLKKNYYVLPHNFGGFNLVKIHLVK